MSEFESKSKQPEQQTDADSNGALLRSSSLPPQGRLAILGAIGLSVSSLLSGPAASAASQAGSDVLKQPLFPGLLIAHELPPLTSELKTEFLESTRKFIRSIPSLERYHQRLESGEITLQIDDMQRAQEQRFGKNFCNAEVAPPLALYFDCGTVVISERHLQKLLAREISKEELCKHEESGTTVARVAIHMLKDTLHEINHGLHDQALEHAVGCKHLFNTQEEELAVELEARTDFELARRFIVDNQKVFPELIGKRPSFVLLDTPRLRRPDLEKQILASYKDIASIQQPREAMLELWKQAAAIHAVDAQEIQSTITILEDEKKFALLKESVEQRLELARKRWDQVNSAHLGSAIDVIAPAPREAGKR